MEGRRLQVGQSVILYLKNGFKYSGVVIRADSNLVIIQDRYKGLVDISQDMISSVEAYKEKGRDAR